jgi:hypothetical protein
MRLQVSTDGLRYLAMAEGLPQAIPYHLRWLLPKLLGIDARKWEILNQISIPTVAMLISVYAWLHGVDPVRAAILGGMFMTLLFVRGFWGQYPILTDTPGMALSMLAAIVPGPWCIPVAILGGCVRETVPIYAALYAWSPWPLVGLVAPALRLLWKPGVERDERVAGLLRNPWRTSWERNKKGWTNWKVMVSPWAGFLFAAFNPSWQLLWVYLACLAPSLRHHTIVRVYIMAVPIVAVALGGVSEWAFCVAVLAHFLVPWEPLTLHA